MGSYTVNEQRLFVREEGPPHGQLALLIHGWSSSWFAVSPLLEQAARRYRCVAVDLPGYGQSPPLPRRATIPEYADLLADLIRMLSRGPAVLIGHSMGGMISVTIALRHPELVDRMVLVCPTLSGRLSGFINAAIAPITYLESVPIGARISRAIESQFVSLTDRMMRPASFAQRSGITPADYNRIRADARRPGQGQVRAECYRAMRENNLTGQLAQVEVPALVLWGAEDNTVPLRDASLVADEWPDADLRIIPRAGHWPQFETPDTTLRHVASFLGLPLANLQSDATVGKTVESVGEVAQFLASSDIGSGLNATQRARLAAHFTVRYYIPGRLIAQADEPGKHLFVVQEGSVEVLPVAGPAAGNPRAAPVTTLLPGQIAGELALLDGGNRSTSMRAGPEGATLLSLRRDKLVALCREDPELGIGVLWNIAAALALRLRLTTRVVTQPITAAGEGLGGLALPETNEGTNQ
jgi:pimeloyl-ACP methyl ester carboxylesterase/CRP-like cAMP-binding protein